MNKGDRNLAYSGSSLVIDSFFISPHTHRLAQECAFTSQRVSHNKTSKGQSLAIWAECVHLINLQLQVCLIWLFFLPLLWHFIVICTKGQMRALLKAMPLRSASSSSSVTNCYQNDIFEVWTELMQSQTQEQTQKHKHKNRLNTCY